MGRVEGRGYYTICYCPEECQDEEGDDMPEAFDQTVGLLEVQIILPETHWCVSGRECNMTLQGLMLSYADRVVLTTDDCGLERIQGPYREDIFRPDAAFGFEDPSMPFVLPPLTPPSITRKCYCDPAGQGSPGDSSLCSAMPFFPARAGLVVVRGPQPKQKFYCMFGVECAMDLIGTWLTDDDHVMAVNISDPGNTRANLRAASRVCEPGQSSIEGVSIPPAGKVRGGTFIDRFQGAGVDWDILKRKMEKPYYREYGLE